MILAFQTTSLTPPQKEIFKCEKRFRTVVAGRRFGKTTLAITELLYEAQAKPKSLNWYIAPTVAMARDLVWTELKEAIPDNMISYINETRMIIILRGCRSKIQLHGADKPDRLRGKGLDFVIFDEVADIKQDTWFLSIRAALSDRMGKALFIGTPKGFNWFYDLFIKGLHAANDNWQSFTFTTAQGGNVPLSEIEDARNDLHPKQFEQEYNASFENLSNTVYSCFSMNDNVDPGIVDLGSESYECCCGLYCR
jgi:hypothetical protein